MTKLTNRNIPLDRLTLSSANVRTTSADPQDDKELQASILSLGVLESLLVVPNGDDTFAVVAGGRRLAALQQLAKAGEIRAGYVAPCRIYNGSADPAEVSLHENEKRAAMHPADQYEAYARLRTKGMTAAEIASRAGVSERQVTKVMRLGTVAPELLAAFRNDEMNLHTLMAFTVTDDRKAQLDVWAKARSGGTTWPEHIRQQLTQGAVIGSSGLASFVGLEAYEKAGGRVQRDLFSQFDDEAVYLLDRGLLVKLAETELKKTADRLAKRWKWVEIQIDPDWDRIHTLHKLRGVPGTPTAAERKRLDELGDRIQDIADSPPMDPAEQGAAYARGQELNAKYEKLEARIAARTKYRPEDMRIAGCIVTLKGARTDVITGLVLPEDVPPKPKKTAEKKAAADAPANTPDAAGAKPADGGEEPAAPTPSFDERFEKPWTTRTTRNHQSPEAAHAKAAGLSTAVIDDLAAIRTGIVRAALAKRFDVAFDLAGVPPGDGHIDARHRAPRRHPPRPHQPAPDEPQQRERLRRRESRREAREPAGRPLDEARRRPEALRRVPGPPRRREARPLRPRGLGRALQPGRQPAPRDADRGTRGRAPRHRLRQGRPAHREVLLETADPRPDARDRGDRRRPGVGEGPPQPQEGAACRRHGRRVRGRPAGTGRTRRRGAGTRRTVGHARLQGLGRPCAEADGVVTRARILPGRCACGLMAALRRARTARLGDVAGDRPDALEAALRPVA